MSLIRLFSLLAFVLVNLVTTAHAQNQDFYWKGSYGRGVGLVPALECPAGKERGGGLCYDECEGLYDMNEAASLCMISCPDGYADRGLICHWQGTASYVPKSDWNSCKSRTAKSCVKIAGKRRCVGGDCIGGWETDCRDGYRNVAGVCWYAEVPNGFSGSALDPMKGSYMPRNPVAQRQVCRDNKIMQDGLCYEPCRSGYAGRGPVCWADTPQGYVDCFTGYAKNTNACISVMATQAAAILIPPAMATYATYKARQAAKVAKAGKAIPDVAEAGLEVGLLIMTKGDAVAKLGTEVMAQAVKGNAAQATSKVVDLLKFMTTTKVLLAMKKAGFASVGASIRPEDYWNTTKTEDILARARDVAGFLSVAIVVYNITYVPPTPPALNPLDITEGILDLMSSFMWTVYGQ
jgi:hypothetical protein